MTKLEQKQAELIELLTSQVVDLSMMSKIELGDDVIEEYNKLVDEINKVKENYVSFVSEVEEFNKLMNKSNNYEPTIPKNKVS